MITHASASLLFYIQAVFFFFGSATLVCGLNLTRLRLHGRIEENVNKLCDQLKKSSPIKIESGNSNTKKRRSDYDSLMRLLLPSKGTRSERWYWRRKTWSGVFRYKGSKFLIKNAIKRLAFFLWTSSSQTVKTLKLIHFLWDVKKKKKIHFLWFEGLVIYVCIKTQLIKPGPLEKRIRGLDLWEWLGMWASVSNRFSCIKTNKKVKS